MLHESGQSEVLIEQARSGILVRPEYADGVSSDWFLPQHWGSAATPVSSGGRGTAWFIRHDTHDWVLRHYSRGGLMAKLSQRSYGYAGADRVRSFAEFRLLNTLATAGLPVPWPVAAWFGRSGAMSYQAAILVRTIPDSRPFADYLGDDNPELWSRVGELVRRFHDAGVYHADLNCHNILVSPEGLHLIDFDKGEQRAESSPDARWKLQNLQRLRRSVEKLLGRQDLGECWERLVQAYGNQRFGDDRS